MLRAHSSFAANPASASLGVQSPSEEENSPLRDRIQKSGTTQKMDKKSKKTSKKHPAGKEAARSEKSDLRPVIHETTPEPPLLRHGEMENPTSVGSPAPTDPGVDHPCGDSPVKEAIRSVDPSGGHEGVKNPLNTVQDSAKVAPSGSHAHHSGDKSVARRSHPQPKEPTSHQGAATVRSLDILLSPDRSDREMDKLVGKLEDESVHAAQTKAKAQHFLSTIVAKATGKPSAVAEAWGIPPEALAQSEAERTIRHQTSSAERQVHPRVGDQTLRHRDESARRPVHPTGSKKGGGQPSDRQPSRHQTKAPRREKSPRRSRADQHSQDRSTRRSKEREGRTESTYSTYHLTGQQRRPSPKMFGRIHYPSPPKDLSQARQHRDFRGDEGKKRRRRKKSKADRREPRPESQVPGPFQA